MTDENARRVRFHRLLPLARSTARQYARKSPRGADAREDLEQAGAEGLWQALLRLDPSRDGALGAFAARRVRGAVLDELRRIDPLTRDQRRQLREARRVESDAAVHLGRAPTEEEIARSLGITGDAYRARLCTYAAARAAGDAIPNAASAADAIDDAQWDPEAACAERRRRAALARAVETLPGRLREVIALYYAREQSLKEIGLHLGVTESRVCQMRGEAIEHLRGEIKASA